MNNAEIGLFILNTRDHVKKILIKGTWGQSTVGKKIAAVHFTTMPCETNRKKAKFLQYLSLYEGY